MPRTEFLLVIATVTLFAVTPAALAKGPQIAEESIEFSATDLDGNTVNSTDSQFENKVLLMTLWGTWCPSCVTEVSTLNDLQTRYADEGLVVVAIAYEPDEDLASRLERLRRFASSHEVEYTILDGGSFSKSPKPFPSVENVRRIPVEILVDRTGTVVDCRNSYGYTKRWANKLEEKVAALLTANPSAN